MKPIRYIMVFQKGFTLLELLVGMAIIGILSSMMLVNFSSGRIRKELDSAAREVASMVREAQNQALTGYQGVTGTDPCRYRVAWTGSSVNYASVYFYKNASGTCSEMQALRSATLPRGIVFFGSGAFYFTPPHANIYETSGTAMAATKAIRLTKAGISYTVCVKKDGLINHVAGATCP